jgi:hypothetical protein
MNPKKLALLRDEREMIRRLEKQEDEREMIRRLGKEDELIVQNV